jgi:mono/diheme cytochrome c family protein
MRRLLKWGGLTIAGLLVLAALAAAIVYIGSERVLAKRYPVRPEPLIRPSPAALADAPRQARLLGCLACHGPGLRGNDVIDTPAVGTITAPNLPRLIRGRTDQQIAAAIRQGVGADGRPLLVMPSGLFSRLSPEEVSALILWMRRLPVVDTAEEPFRLALLGRFMVLNGDMPRQPELVPVYQRQMPADAGPNHALGRRIAALTCAECHAPDLSGGARPHADFNTAIGEGTPATPDLAIAAAYDLPAFMRLLRTGVPPDGRDLGMMASVAREDFRHLTDAEITALHGYFRARSERQ